jgi:cytochrome P450
MLKDPSGLLIELRAKYGNVVRFGTGAFSYTALLGAEANRYLLSENPENFTWREALKSLIAVDGETALVVTDGPEHKRRRRMVQPAFAVRAIDGYLDGMIDAAEREVATWKAGEDLDVYARLRRVIREIAVRTLFGDTLGAREEEFGDHLLSGLEVVNNPWALVFPTWMPGIGWRKAARDRAKVVEIVQAEIERRRGLPPTENDLLDRLIHAVDEEGGPSLTDTEICDQVISLVAAGYETTSGSIGWATHLLLHNEGEWERAAKEVANVVGDARLTPALLQQLTHLDNVIQETLRLWPAAFMSGRMTQGDFSFEGHRIEKGSFILYSPYVTGRDPQLWDDADAFVPDRWIDNTVDPYAFVPFGGGYRRCIGFAFATQELKVLLVEMLRRVEMIGQRPTATPTGVASLWPKGGVPVRIHSVS